MERGHGQLVVICPSPRLYRLFEIAGLTGTLDIVASREAACRLDAASSLGGMPNRLAGETSPYLLQHKDNPVDWYPVGRGGARRARARRTGRSCSRSATPPATGAT